MKNSNNPRAPSEKKPDLALRWIWFLGSLFLILGFGTVMLADAARNLRCKRALDAPGTQLLHGQLIKVKKNRRGNFIWEVEFSAPGGSRLHGRREAFEHMNGSREAGGSVPILYAPDAPECWDFSISEERPLPYVARQNFAITVNGAFGVFFVLAGFLLTIWSGNKLFRPSKL